MRPTTNASKNNPTEAMAQTPLLHLPDKLASYLKHGSVDPRLVHSLSLKLGCICSTFLCNNLLQSYISKSSVGNAHKLFEEIPHPNIISWSVVITGYARIGKLKSAVGLFDALRLYFVPNRFVLGSVLAGCARARDLCVGMQVHCSMVKFGVEFDVFVVSLLIDMYAKCGVIQDSCKVFDLAPRRDVVAWTSMITCLSNCEQQCFRDSAFQLFKHMICSGVRPVIMTFASIVKVFDAPEMLDQAKQAHGCMLKLGIEVDNLLGSALIAMYGKCGGIDEVIRVSVRMEHDLVSLTALLVAYMHNGFNKEAINTFRRMVSGKMMIDQFVFTSAIRSCSDLQELRLGKELHGYALKNCFLSDVSVSNAVITHYGRCGKVREAEKVFELMLERDIISWTALLTSYSQNFYGEEAILLFSRILQASVSPPIFCITGALSACSTIPSLCMGQQIHSRTVKMGISEDLSVGNSLVTMYARCGNIDHATRLFHLMQRRDTISWNALINGFSQHGFEKEALEVFHRMQAEGIRPDDLTFIGILVSCSRAGLVGEGCEFFSLMSEAYELAPKMEHYACMVDLFGRAGKLGDAMEFIDAMPLEPDQLVWEALLASCKVHGDVEIGKLAAMKILQIRPEEPSPYLAVSSIHALMGMWDGKACVRALMNSRGAQKEPGRSWLEAQVITEDTLDVLQPG